MSDKSLHAEFVTITPEKARTLLEEHNKRIAAGTFRQRAVSGPNIRKYAADMRMGNWAVTGQGISIDENGNLLDGQNRLWAIVKSNVPVKILVASGLPEFVNNGGPKKKTGFKTIDAFDIGQNRSLSMQFRIDGVPYYTHLGSMCRMMGVLCTGLMKQRISPTMGHAIADLFEGHFYVLMDKINAAQNVSRARGYILAPLCLLRCQNKDLADEFTESYATLVNLKEGSPILALNRFMTRPMLARGGSEFQMAAQRATVTSLYRFVHHEKADHIRGDSSHMDWLLKLARTQVSKVREILGSDIAVTDKELRGERE